MWNVAHITTRVYKSTLIIGVVSVHGYTISWNMAMISMYREEIRLLSRQEVVEERKQLFRLLNGDAFFPEKSWPKDIRLIFWKKPMGDKETFKLLLFFHGNGCNPEIISRWILLAQSWASSQATAEKRARQIQFVNDNVDSKRNQWFYFDLDYSKLLYLNRLPRQTPRQQLKVTSVTWI